MQSGPRRGQLNGRQPDYHYFTQPRPTYKNAPPGYGSGPGNGPDPGFGPAPGPAPIPNGRGWNWLPLILGWGMFIVALVFTGIVVAAVADLEKDPDKSETFDFYETTYPVIVAIVLTIGSLLNIVNGKFGSELTKALAIVGSGMAFVAAIICFTITTKTLDEADGKWHDKDENYLTALDVTLGAEVLLSFAALLTGLVSFHMRRPEPLPPY